MSQYVGTKAVGAVCKWCGTCWCGKGLRQPGSLGSYPRHLARRSATMGPEVCAAPQGDHHDSPASGLALWSHWPCFRRLGGGLAGMRCGVPIGSLFEHGPEEFPPGLAMERMRMCDGIMQGKDAGRGLCLSADVTVVGSGLCGSSVQATRN